MPVRSTGSSSPTSSASFGRLRQRRRDRVVREREVVERRRRRGLGASGLPVIVSMLRRRRGLAPPRGSVLMKSIGVDLALRAASCTDVGVLLEELGAHDEVRGHELARRATGRSRRRAPCRRPRGRGASPTARAPRRRRCARPGTRRACARSPAARSTRRRRRRVSVSRPLLLQPRAQRDVLRVAELRGGDLLALEVLDAC